ncbi:hypothetical protein K493DRAFT_149513, partial [Basidiobolus meristosporus CBS 931.73]
DFRRFLKHKEHSIENLDFYKWYLAYCKKFNSLPSEQQGKSPPPAKYKLSIYGDMGQPFRDEVDEAIEQYFTLHSETEVNVGSSIRSQLLKDASETTNPAIFENAVGEVLSMLINSSIPNF